ncbi:MAG TPA: DUF5752 family protein [Desulfobacteria bacterium]|nr:DUF5752 family protein [Desulfobacteria bacterium]
MNSNNPMPLYIKDCTLIALATGKRAQNLRELREHLRVIPTNCIYYHFWGGLLRPRFDDPEYHNDFAIWAAHSIHNKMLAERLAVIDPVAFRSMEDLRRELLDVIEESLDETEFPIWARRDDQFEFIQHQIVVFDTHKYLEKPDELETALSEFSMGSLFFHVIDARQRNENSLDDFQNWLTQFGPSYKDLRDIIGTIDPYFTSLNHLKERLLKAIHTYQLEGDANA